MESPGWSGTWRSLHKDTGRVRRNASLWQTVDSTAGCSQFRAFVKNSNHMLCACFKTLLQISPAKIDEAALISDLPIEKLSNRHLEPLLYWLSCTDTKPHIHLQRLAHLDACKKLVARLVAQRKWIFLPGCSIIWFMNQQMTADKKQGVQRNVNPLK